MEEARASEARQATSPVDAAFAARLAEAAPGIAALLRQGGASAERRAEAWQEACARAWAARASYDPTRPFGPWLAAIAANVAAEFARSDRRRREREARGALPADAATAPADDPLATAARRDELARRMERLTEGLKELDDMPRRILLRFHRDGASLQELGAEFGLPLNTVKSHLRRTRLRLAERLGARRAEDA